MAVSFTMHKGFRNIIIVHCICNGWATNYQVVMVIKRLQKCAKVPFAPIIKSLASSTHIYSTLAYSDNNCYQKSYTFRSCVSYHVFFHKVCFQCIWVNHFTCHWRPHALLSHGWSKMEVGSFRTPILYSQMAAYLQNGLRWINVSVIYFSRNLLQIPPKLLPKLVAITRRNWAPINTFHLQNYTFWSSFRLQSPGIVAWGTNILL